MITNKINLFGLARVEDKFKMQKVLLSSWSSHHDTGRGPEHISCYLCNFKFVETNKFIRNHTDDLQRWMWMDSLFLATIHKPLFTYRLFDCCLSSIKKYRLGTSKCRDHDILTLHQPIRLQHLEWGYDNCSFSQYCNLIGWWWKCKDFLSQS